MARVNLVTQEEKSTRELILRSAIHHFAEHGYEGARIRQILVEEGLNVALAHYYFGSKGELYVSAIHHYLDEVLSRRRTRLVQWKGRKGPKEDRVVSLMFEYTMPHFIIASREDGYDYARLMQRILNDHGPRAEALLEPVTELRQKFCDELQIFFPDLPNQLLFRSIEALGAIMVSESVNHAEELLRATRPDRERMNEQRAMFCSQLISGGLFQLSKRYTQR